MYNRMNDTNLAKIIGPLRAFSDQLIKHSAGAMLRIMRQEDLSMPQIVALIFLQRTEDVSISDIAAHLNLSLGAASHLVDRLVIYGLVTRTEDQIDRRLKQVMLTDAGRTLVEELRHARAEDMARQLASLPQPLLTKLLDSMAEAVEYLRDNDVTPPERSRRRCAVAPREHA